MAGDLLTGPPDRVFFVLCPCVDVLAFATM